MKRPRRRFIVSVVACLALAGLGAGVISLAAAAGTVVSGTVSGSDQGPLKGASISLDGSGKRETVTDADGRFTFADVPAGQYRFRALAEGYLPADQTMQVGTASISVDVVLLKLPGVP
ncbi:MAG: carboxypeptidase-like regulatory domain-containing protein [Vicinamibacterales bacterium]